MEKYEDPDSIVSVEWKKEFYERDPRSRKIRETARIILEKINLLTEDECFALREEEKSQLQADLERLSTKLLDLGITEDMALGHPPEEYKTNPVLAAEFAAGQLMVLLAANLHSASDIIPTIEEHDELPNKTTIDNIPTRLTPATINVKTTEFRANRGMLHGIETMLALQ